MEIKKPKTVDKTWGKEMWVHNDEEYCGKLLVFPKKYEGFSMHYHIIKKETWYVQEGRFLFEWINTEEPELKKEVLELGDSVVIERGQPHKLTPLEDDSIIFEVSTEHFDEDSYRIYRKNPNELT